MPAPDSDAVRALEPVAASGVSREVRASDTASAEAPDRRRPVPGSTGREMLIDRPEDPMPVLPTAAVKSTTGTPVIGAVAGSQPSVPAVNTPPAEPEPVVVADMPGA